MMPVELAIIMIVAAFAAGCWFVWVGRWVREAEKEQFPLPNAGEYWQLKHGGVYEVLQIDGWAVDDSESNQNYSVVKKRSAKLQTMGRPTTVEIPRTSDGTYPDGEDLRTYLEANEARPVSVKVALATARITERLE